MTATHWLRINGLWLARSALGSSTSHVFEGHECTVTTPSVEYDFGLDARPVGWDRDALHLYETDGERVTGTVQILRVDVAIDADLTADELPPGGPADPAITEAAYRILADSADIARRLVAASLAWARTDSGQFWLDPQHHLPRVVVGSELRDGSGARLAISFVEPVTAHGVGGGATALSAPELSVYLHAASVDAAPALAETLLADALFYAWRATHPNPRLGLVLAAIATEVKIKTFLTDMATPEQAALVELVLSSPRDVSLAAAALFDQGLNAVAGVSLRTANRKLFKAVSKLFEDRNRFAHRGDLQLDEASMRADMNAAREVFRWLDDQALAWSQQDTH